MVQQLTLTFAVAVMTFCIIRLLDIAWPTKVMPWQCYALELCVAMAVIIAIKAP